MRLWRGIRRGVLIIILVLPTGALGTLLALGWSGPGRKFLTRLVEQVAAERIAGNISIGSIDGNLIHHIVLHQVSVHDTLGVAVVVAERIEASYDVLELISGKSLLFHDVDLDTASVHLVLSKDNRWNFQNVLRSGVDTLPILSPAVPAAPVHIEFTAVTLREVSLRLDVATPPNPPPRLTLRHATPPPAPRIEKSADGFVRVYTVEGLNGRFPTVRISTPARDPLLVQVDSLRARLSDPALDIRGLHGVFLQGGDSLGFTVQHAALPGTVVHGSGAVRWPRSARLFDFTLVADTLDLKDLRFISPDFPDWQGKTHLIAKAQGDFRTTYQLDHFQVGDGKSSATGSLTAITDLVKGLGFKDLNLQLVSVPLSVARPYIDSIPFAGTLNGRLLADGFFDAMHLGGELVFTDALVDGQPHSRLAMDGIIHFGGKEGAVFQEFRLAESSLDLGTIRRMVPSMVVKGTLDLAGRLDGGWQNIKFNGTTEHVAPDQSRTRLLGAVGLDTRDTLLAVDIDGMFDQLSWDALRSGYPSIKARGGMTGHLALKGRLDAMTVDAALTGDIGTVRAVGNLQAANSIFGTDSLAVDFARISTDALLGKWGSNAFNGHALLRGQLDSAGTPRGTLAMTVDPSRIESFSFQGGQVRLHADSGLVVIDTLQMELPEGWIDVVGSLGLDKKHAGTLSIDAGFRSLTPFDSLARSYLGFSVDTVMPRPLDGTVHGTFTVTGSLDEQSIDGVFQARGLVLDQWRIAQISADVRADSLGDRGLALVIEGDSISHGGQLLEHARAGLTGRLDSLRYAIDGHMYRTQFAALGTWLSSDSGGSGRLDSLALNNPNQQWRLKSPTRVAFNDGRPELADTLVLESRNGDGEVTLSGALPGTSPGSLSVGIVGLDLHDVISAVQRDSSNVGGIGSANFVLGGTAKSPTVRGSAAVTGPTLDDVHLPMLRAAFDFKDERLSAQVTAWKLGSPLLQADVSLPLNLAFNADGDRKLPGAIDITAHTDSADLGILDAVTTSVRNAHGSLDLDMHATGTWKSPRLGGTARIANGSMILPDLGVRWNGIAAGIRFTGDSMVFDSLRVHSDGGTASVTGQVRFEQLVKPILGLDIELENFLAVDRAGDMTIRPTGELKFSGTPLRPLMTGNVSLSKSVFYYSDLVNKALIDPEDPRFADLVDTASIRRKGVGATAADRFLAALRIENLRFKVDREVWLRSPEANILLTSEGDVFVNKPNAEFDIQGQFNTAQGTYTYSIQNLINKEFKIDHGKVSFIGTNDRNANLDISATYTVHSEEDGDIPIVAEITGDIQKPNIKLTSPGRIIPDGDLLSLLLFNQRAFRVTSNKNSAQILAAAAGSSLASSTINQAISTHTNLGLEFNLFEDRRGVSARKDITSRSTFSVSGTLCRFGGEFAWGAATEYRLGGGFRAQLSRSPIQSCVFGLTPDLLKVTYQYGAGLFWKRDY